MHIHMIGANLFMRFLFLVDCSPFRATTRNKRPVSRTYRIPVPGNQQQQQQQRQQ